MKTANQPSSTDRAVIVSFDRNVLPALLHIAASQDIRYYLNSVAIDCTGKEPRIVATDGNMIGIESAQYCDGTDANGRVFILKRDDIDMALKLAPKSAQQLVVTLKPESWEISGTNLTRPYEDGKYPDWRRVTADIQHDAPCNMPALSLELLEAILKAHKARSKGKKFLPLVFRQQTGNPAGLVLAYTPSQPTFYVALMPMRLDKKEAPITGIDTLASKARGN